MKNLLFSVFILWASLSGLAYGQSCTYYTLQNGETMSSISNGNNNLFVDLLTANPTINYNTATTGTQICIPTSTYSSYKLTTASTCTPYTLQNGETFNSISNGNSNLLIGLINANPTINFNTATTGTVVCIPNSYYSSYKLSTASNSCTYYTMKAGDTYSSISNGNSAQILALVNANPSINPSTATTGTVICIPTATYSSYNLNSASTSCTYYTVKSGDTFSTLSNGNSVLYNALAAANPTLNGGALTVGSQICIPTASYSSYNLNSASTSCTYYTVKSGDTFSTLSNGNAVLYNALAAANPTLNGGALTVGSQICIPTAYYSSYNFNSASSCTYYTVKSGDTFSTLSNGNTALYNSLAAANPSLNGAALAVGSQICIPSAYYSSYNFNTATTSCTYYTVKSGDSFSTLSNGNTALYNSLAAANPSLNGAALAVGSQICIPSAYYSSYNFNTASTSCTYYTIKSGDTYYSLSNGNSALISALSAANPSVNPSALAAGQTICIPNAYYSSYNFNSASTTSCTPYTIKSGDTYYSLSNGNSALISSLTAANPTVNPSALVVGQTICIPNAYYSSYSLNSGYSTGSCTSYTIKSGDTYYSISNGNSALISALTAANPTVNPSALSVGQTICIPNSNAGSYNTYSSSSTSGCTYYTIKSGQTYYSLSNGNSALISQLTLANPSLNPSNIAVGTSICIPNSYYSSFNLY